MQPTIASTLWTFEKIFGCLSLISNRTGVRSFSTTHTATALFCSQQFLTYANQWDIEGLIATTSIHQKARVAPESIDKILRAYGNVQPNLLKHEGGYHSYMQLKSKVKKGLPVYGMEGVGEGKDSPGSDWIVQALNKPDERPVWFSVWGGTNVLAQALWKIQHTKSPADAEKLYNKIRVYAISDQDDTGPWIRKTFPTVFYIVTPGYNYAYATWLGMSFPFPRL